MRYASPPAKNSAAALEQCSDTACLLCAETTPWGDNPMISNIKFNELEKRVDLLVGKGVDP